MKAEWPGDLLGIRNEIEQALVGERHSDIVSPSRVGEGGSGPDLLTYITISHALSSSRMVRGISKKIQVGRLSRSCGDDIVRYSKARPSSSLSLATIGGNDTADPRGKGGERLIKIVQHGTTVQIGDQETLFTANIGQHYRLLLDRVDTAYGDALDSLNSIKMDDNMDDDNVSMVDDDVDSGSPLDVETEAHHAPLEDEEDMGIIENEEGDGGGEGDFIDAGEGGGGGEGGEGGEGDDNNLSVVGGGEGGDDGGENENGGGGGEGGDDGGENENVGGGGEDGDDGGDNENGGGGEARGNRRSSRVGGNPNTISGVGGGGGPVSDSRRRRRRAGTGRQGPVSGTTSRRRRRRDGRQPRGGASAQPNDEIPEGTTNENDNETLNSDESVVGKDAQVLAKSLEMMKIFDDLQVGLGLFNEYKGFSDIEFSINAYEQKIPRDICTVPSCREYNHHLSRLCEKHMTQFIPLETKPEEITALQATLAEVNAVDRAFDDNVYLAGANRDGGDDDDLDYFFEDDLFATSANNSGDEAQRYDRGDPGQSSVDHTNHEFGERLVGLLGQARQEYEVERTTINDDELDDASLD
jgi:hypothetical protein